MKKLSTPSGSVKRLLLTTLVVICTALQAFAGGDGFYSFWSTLSAYPTGAGKVYATLDSAANQNITIPDVNGDEFTDFTQPGDEVSVKFVYHGSSWNYNAYAQPAQGWIFAGWSAATRDNDGELVFNDTLRVLENPGSLAVSGSTSYDNKETALVSFPLLPDTAWYGIFTHVFPTVAEGQSRLGKVSSSKMVNELGDNVTFTATPGNANTTRFAYWLNKTTGEKFTDNPLSMQVTDTARYEAHFDCDSAIYIDFSKNGGYAIIYNELGFSVPANAEEYNFNFISDPVTPELNDSLTRDEATGKAVDLPSISGFQTHGMQPHIFHGDGEACFVLDPTLGAEDNPKTMLRWSGASGVSLDTLSTTRHYYSIDLTNRQFKLISFAEGAMIAPNTAYYELDNAQYEVLGFTEAPDVIYWEIPSDVTAIDHVKSKAAATPKGVYTIDGKKVSTPAIGGLYIVDGKKVIYRLK